jgi:hypothetical protein
MAEISKFFNSASGDPRTYQASDFADYFGSVLSTGLLHTDNIPALEVKCDGNDLRTYVTPGKAIIQGYLYENTSNLYLDHALPEPALDRIDRIVLRLDKRNQSRFIKLFVKQGVPSSNPVPPDLQRDDFIYELSLAQIRVRANTSTLNPADLIDERLDENLCGLVHSLISIPTSQFQAQWDLYFNAKKDEIDAETLNYLQQLSSNIASFEQEWDTWFSGIQNEGFASAEEFNAHLADYVKHPPFAVTTGSANAYEVTLTPAPTAYEDGFGIVVAIHADSTGASTLNVNGLGAIPIKKPNGNDVTNLKANGVYTLRYSAGNFILQGEGGGGTAQPEDVLSGKTFTNDNGEQTGTMENHGAIIIIPSTVNQVIPQGYHNGLGIVEGSPNLLPENIKSGVNIFGVVGSLIEGYSVDTLKFNNTSIPNDKLQYSNYPGVGAFSKTFYDTSLNLSFIYLKGDLKVLAMNDQNGEYCYSRLYLKTKADNNSYLLNQAYAANNYANISKVINYLAIITMGDKSIVISSSCDFNTTGFKTINKIDLSQGFSLYGEVYFYSDSSPINSATVEINNTKIFGT